MERNLSLSKKAAVKLVVYLNEYNKGFLLKLINETVWVTLYVNIWKIYNIVGNQQTIFKNVNNRNTFII